MDGWNKWIGKKVYLETNSGRKYSGEVKGYFKGSQEGRFEIKESRFYPETI